MSDIPTTDPVPGFEDLLAANAAYAATNSEDLWGFDGIARAAGLPTPRWRVPASVAKAAGTVLERVWAGLRRQDDPPITSFLAEQLSTAHWFDQRATQRALAWEPSIGLDEGFARLAAGHATEVEIA